MRERSRAFRATFHALGLSGTDRASDEHGGAGGSSAGRTYLTLTSIMRLLGHARRRIDFLKVDIEGFEWKAFLGADESAQREGVFAECAAGSLRVDQLLIELHADLHKTQVATDFARAEHFFLGADRCGLKIFSKEANVYACPAVWNCAGTIFEYSLVAPRSVQGGE
uniref:Methyltransferase domain-containing protein n=1 Tax=Prymnesium polylepis TaxID=72548 RepID=A0A7S4HK94_9EUKA